MLIGCDIDGVLADIRDFYHIIPDWEEYYKHTLELPVIREMTMLVGSLLWAGHHEVVFVTGRPQRTESDTRQWLLMNVPHLSSVNLKMRPDGDFRSSTDIKMEIVRELKPSLIIEDEPKVVEAMKAEGFVVLQIHGYRLTKEDNIPFLTREAQERIL